MQINLETFNTIVAALEKLSPILIIPVLKMLYDGVKERRMIKFEKDEEGQKHQVTVHLTQSRYFSVMRSLLVQVSLYVKLPNEGKTKIFRRLIKAKIQAYIDEHEKLAAHLDKCFKDGVEITDEELFNLNMDAFDAAYNSYTTFWHNNPEYTEDEKWCLQYCNDIFHEHYHQGNIDRTLEIINSTCFSVYNSNYRSKQEFIFNAYIGAFNSVLVEFDKMFHEMNGHMNGKVFKGTII